MRISLFLIFMVLYGCNPIRPEMKGSDILDHDVWNKLLKKHVSNMGEVDYPSFLLDSALLSNYLQLLSQNGPDTAIWSREDELAYYINLYNAATVQLILRHHPLKSIKDIGSSIQIPFVNTPWQIEFIQIGSDWYDLDDIEHNIIRAQFNEPRIHFALVCAAKSCPILRNEAYVGKHLEKQLENQSFLFLTDESKNRINNQEWGLSRIFRWYGGDFDSVGGVEAYILNNHPHISRSADIKYLDYNWELNGL